MSRERVFDALWILPMSRGDTGRNVKSATLGRKPQKLTAWAKSPWCSARLQKPRKAILPTLQDSLVVESRSRLELLHHLVGKQLNRLQGFRK